MKGFSEARTSNRRARTLQGGLSLSKKREGGRALPETLFPLPFMIQNTGYQPQQKTEKRRKIITQTILKHSFDSVYTELRELKENLSGYKTDRVENDLSWMEKQYRKGRYNSTLLQQQQDNGKTRFHESTKGLRTL